MVLGDERRGIKFSLITDSRPQEQMINFIKESDLFICEGMYGEADKLNKAKEYIGDKPKIYGNSNEYNNYQYYKINYYLYIFLLFYIHHILFCLYITD
mgnify:CR=1 FL=1